MEVDNALVVNLAGKIHSVACKNFVTYKECIMYPTEYLNVIIGPNGTGKSTLVSAIVLGMGGSPKLLSRASSLQDYLKNGETAASIVINIYINNEKDTKQFRRDFDANGKSYFQVDGEVLSHKEYLRIISEFNIQVDNLCQFLPQDRVQDFAKMNPQELLNSTISSVCQPDVLETFNELKDLQKKQSNSKKTLVDDIHKLEDLKKRNEGLKQILERIATRKKFADTINVCNAKKMWMEVKELKAKAGDIRGNLEDAEKMVIERNHRYKTLMVEQRSVIEKTEDLIRDMGNQVDKVRSLERRIEHLIGKIDEQQEKIRRAKHEFETAKKEQAEREKEILSESQSLNVLTEELKRAVLDSGSDAERASRLQTIKEKVSRLKVEISAQIAKRSEINKRLDEDYIAELQNLKQRIQSLESFRELKLKLLENRFPDQYKAVMWLRNNLDKFEGRVYEPMILELNVKDPSHAKYFENSIALRDLLAFTCESKSDMSKLINYFSIEQQLSVSIVYSAPASSCQFTPAQPISAYRHYGFFAYLLDLVEGPPAILNYLCYNHQIDRILIGTEKVNDHLDTMPPNIRNFFGGNVRYNVSISKYSRETIRSQTRIQDRNLLGGVDQTELNGLKKRFAEKARAADLLRNERSQIEAKTDELEHQRSDIMREQRAFEMEVSKLRELKERVVRQTRRVKHLKLASVDIPSLQSKMKEQTKNYLGELIHFQQEKVKCISEFQTAIVEKERATTRVSIFQLENEELNRAINEATESLNQAKKLVETVKIAMDSAAKKYRLRLVEAKHLTNGYKPSDPRFPYVKEFSELPDDMEALKDIINDTSARLECLGENDMNVREEYEQRCAQIDALTQSIKDTQHGEERIKSQMKKLYGSWIREIERIVEILNLNFGLFMKSMDYVGEVLLARNDEWDFESYGIQILVQYRNGAKLQALDRYVQSGGERAVAIAIYSLSLQQLTHVPFRCVDEINQGMDPRNERKIFDMLVEETTKIGSSQYFFVTPKLLPHLNYNEKMTVHVVFNGKFVKPKTAFDFVI